MPAFRALLACPAVGGTGEPEELVSKSELDSLFPGRDVGNGYYLNVMDCDRISGEGPYRNAVAVHVQSCTPSPDNFGGRYDSYSREVDTLILKDLSSGRITVLYNQ